MSTWPLGVAWQPSFPPPRCLRWEGSKGTPLGYSPPLIPNARRQGQPFFLSEWRAEWSLSTGVMHRILCIVHQWHGTSCVPLVIQHLSFTSAAR